MTASIRATGCAPIRTTRDVYKRQGVDRIDLARHGFNHLLNLIGGRNGVALMLDTRVVEDLLGQRDLHA